MNIYVGNLARTVTEEMLRKLFEEKGEVTTVKIIKDKFTGDPRGFGFLEMPNADEAQQAINDLNNFKFEEQILRVNEARQPDARAPRRTGGYTPRYGSDNRGGGSRGGNGGGSWGSNRPKRF